MKIQVLGTGCMKCKKLYAAAQEALAGLGVEAELEKVEKLEEIMKHGVALTPALVIDGEVVSAGGLPRTAQIAEWITAAAARG